MGTNYYLKTKDGRRLHVGKASAGWRFMFSGDAGPRSFAEWKPLLKEGELEGDAPVTPEEFARMVEARKGGRMTDEPGFRPDWVDDEGNPFLRGEFS